MSGHGQYSCLCSFPVAQLLVLDFPSGCVVHERGQDRCCFRQIVASENKELALMAQEALPVLCT